MYTHKYTCTYIPNTHMYTHMQLYTHIHIHTSFFFVTKSALRASGMAQWAKALATKLNELSPILGIHTVEGEH